MPPPWTESYYGRYYPSRRAGQDDFRRSPHSTTACRPVPAWVTVHSSNGYARATIKVCVVVGDSTPPRHVKRLRRCPLPFQRRLLTLHGRKTPCLASGGAHGRRARASLLVEAPSIRIVQVMQEVQQRVKAEPPCICLFFGHFRQRIWRSQQVPITWSRWACERTIPTPLRYEDKSNRVSVLRAVNTFVRTNWVDSADQNGLKLHDLESQYTQ